MTRQYIKHTPTKADIQKKIDMANEELLQLFPEYNNGYAVDSNISFVLCKDSSNYYHIDFFFPYGVDYQTIVSGDRKECFDGFNPYMAAKEMYNRFCKNRNSKEDYKPGKTAACSYHKPGRNVYLLNYCRNI